MCGEASEECGGSAVGEVRRHQVHCPFSLDICLTKIAVVCTLLLSRSWDLINPSFIVPLPLVHIYLSTYPVSYSWANVASLHMVSQVPKATDEYTLMCKHFPSQICYLSQGHIQENVIPPLNGRHDKATLQRIWIPGGA